jgi:hypothetical protein
MRDCRSRDPDVHDLRPFSEPPRFGHQLCKRSRDFWVNRRAACNINLAGRI